MKMEKKERILITGGNGFIGSHLAMRLREEGYKVFVADITPIPSQMHGCEQSIGNLCDPMFCSQVVRGVNVIFHFAANMGGMGAIHTTNDFFIYRENCLMTLCLLEAAISAGVKSFFYASSACVYPNSAQSDASGNVSLKENDVCQPPRSQGLYGLQKLHTEHILDHFRDKIEVFIARFHNVYGPNGAWMGGREKAPAALLRKALVIKELKSLLPSNEVPRMEIWGDGSQKRSFLYVDDCIEAIIALWKSSWHYPLNIGSDSCVSISELAILALHAAGERDTNPDRFHFIGDGPMGVASRNSNNDLAYEKLGRAWITTGLREGLERTKTWMEGCIRDNLFVRTCREDALRGICSSKTLDMRSDKISFAILLPVTSRELPWSTISQNLRAFAASLCHTTWRETHDIGSTDQYTFTIYVAIDDDDETLNTSNRPVIEVLYEEGITQVEQLVCNVDRGHVCELWRLMAERAYKDGHDYFVLMGDDVELQDCNWMTRVHAEFRRFHEIYGVPSGFGCVAFTDTTFPGMPTFPIVQRKHLEIFGLNVVPKLFINQDGDPYLFQLYRRWGCSSMIEHRLRNRIGGSNDARYTKKRVPWTFDTLSNSTAVIESWLAERACSARKLLTLDVIVPSYRVDHATLDKILALRSSCDCSVMFIIIIDDPTSPATLGFEYKHAHRPDVRIRCNKVNLGASASRNRGLAESAAEWVIFLDDDVVPDPDVLIQADRIIRDHPEAAGFVGNTVFPPADTIFKAAAHLAGVTYFWDIATKLTGAPAMDVPWGVTANLIARRDYDDGVHFDIRFPKTGGGEDIAFCRNKRDKWMERGEDNTGFQVAPQVKVTHPWWSNGTRSYWRFYMWSKGDGALVGMYPDLVYRDHAPNSAECLLLALVVLILGAALLPFSLEFALCLIQMSGLMFFSITLSNIAQDWYRHLFRDRERARQLNVTLGGFLWLFAVTESTLIRMVSEMGRLVGMIERREVFCLGKRFDWFAGQLGDGPRNEERKNNVQRLILVSFLTTALVHKTSSAL